MLEQGKTKKEYSQCKTGKHRLTCECCEAFITSRGFYMMIAVQLILGHPSGGRNEESVSEFTSLLLCHKIKYTSLWALEKLKVGQSLPIELSSQFYYFPPLSPPSIYLSQREIFSAMQGLQE